MADPIPINLAAIEARAAQREAKQIVARQVLSEERFEEGVERGFNPAAAEREQGRYNRFRPLESRLKPKVEAEQQIEAVDEKSEEDLARDFNRRNPELPPDRLRQLRSGLRQRSAAEDILDAVGKSFRDPTLADEALDYLERTTDGELHEQVVRARMLHRQKREREIIAGRNVDTAAKMFHKKGIGSDPTELRDLYRDITGNPRDHNTLFSQLANAYPFDQLQMVVAFLLKGLGYDMKSKGPSIAQAELMRLMTETRNLQSILWVYLFFRSRMDLMRLLYSQFDLTFEEALTFELLAKEYIHFVEERYPSVLKLLKETDKMGLKEDIEKVIVLQQFRDAVRELSPRLYKSARHRQDLLLIILEALEELEEEEEEAEE